MQFGIHRSDKVFYAEMVTKKYKLVPVQYIVPICVCVKRHQFSGAFV